MLNYGWGLTVAERRAADARASAMARRRARAAFAVRSAVLSGRLPHPSFLRCADCDADAQCYDHRDYRRPLDVWPVCYSCDAKRGSGFPYDGADMHWNARRLETAQRIRAMIASEKAQLRAA